MTFLSSRRAAGGTARATLLGVPYDATASFRRGSRFGPGAIRDASQSIETYSPRLDRDLDDLAFTDGGDIDVDGLDTAALGAAIEHASPPGLPFLLGGEHTITLGAVRAAARAHSDLTVVQWDAHTDQRDDYEGARVCHATVMRRILDDGRPLVQLGIRAGTKAEFELARRRSLHCAQDVAWPPDLLDTVRGRPLYLTVDIDVLDPGEAPGTGNPEPDGASYAALVDSLRSLAGARIAGMDLVEVAPALDPSGRTPIVAASLVREMLLLFAA